MAFSDTRKWNAFWISGNRTLKDWQAPVLPAPFFRKEFEVTSTSGVQLHICGLGYNEVWINGKRVGDGELMPAPTNYDRHCGYLSFDICEYLKPGKNTIGVILGNGHFNNHTAEAWHFDKAVWRSYPKVILEIEQPGKTILSSDDSWKCSYNGPITFDGIRNGEEYNAMLEFNGWSENGFDDTEWEKAIVVPGAGGELFLQTSPLCRVTEVFPMYEVSSGIFDAGQNISGRVELTVKGVAGSVVTVEYTEILGSDGQPARERIERFTYTGDFQTERYTLKGEGVEKWHSRFTYHGFRYVKVTVSGEVEIISLTAQVIHSDFKKIGEFSCSDDILNKIIGCTRRSYLSNMVGIPTDCPHREKNGWLNDQQLATESGLFNYESQELYREWLGTIRDCQRPNGHIPGMVPTSGWGYNWGSGPLFSAAIMGIPRDIYIYRGNPVPMRECYQAAKKDLEFTSSVAPGNIVRFGLGDWKHPEFDRSVEADFLSTGWYYRNLMIFSDAARLFGFEDDVKWSLEKAFGVKQAFLREYSNGNGSFAKDESTALACAVAWGLCPEDEVKFVVEKLKDNLLACRCTADFGIVGAKYAPRVLAQHGYADVALEIFTQPEYPGWAKWIIDGETALLEDFAGKESHNHIMFGDVSAWLMQYVAGIEPSFERPGFSSVVLKPCFVKALQHVSAWYDTCHGRIEVKWQRKNGKVEFKSDIPSSLPGKLVLSDGKFIEFSGSFETAIDIQ